MKKPLQHVQIYGNYRKKILPIQTDSKGRLITVSRKHVIVDCGFIFREVPYEVETGDEFIALPVQNISHSTQYVYAVKNTGDVDAEVNIQVGPDPCSMAHDLGPQIIPSKKTVIVTPLRFSKYIRLLYRSVEKGQSTPLMIVYQAQIHK